jgi:agmatine/peptidylarginine deiminase
MAAGKACFGFLAALCGLFASTGHAFMTGDGATSGGELIVLAAPAASDPYYASVADPIFDFHVAFARQIHDRDRVIVLTDAALYPRYAAALGENRVAMAPMSDIWARDYSFSNATDPVLLRYTAAGQGGGKEGQRDADHVQRDFKKLAAAAKLRFRTSALLNDGGNVVDDFAGNAVIGKKFLRDNKLTETAARTRLRKLGFRNVAFIEADEQGGLEHADGVVSFVGANTLIVNAYPEDPEYARALRADLARGLPGAVIHEMPTPYDASAIYDPRFGSACGLYTNALATPERIYLPQFGVPEDAEALRIVRAASRREVVPVRSDIVCRMGGGVRCLSAQLRGDNAEALLRHLKKSGR